MLKNRRLKNTFIIFGCFIFLCTIVLMPYIVAQSKFCNYIFKDKGQIGDIIGGTTAPLIGLLGIVFTFIAFLKQIKFNNYQVIQLFENSFFNLIDRHSILQNNLLKDKERILNEFINEIEEDFNKLKNSETSEISDTEIFALIFLENTTPKLEKITKDYFQSLFNGKIDTDRDRCIFDGRNFDNLNESYHNQISQMKKGNKEFMSRQFIINNYLDSLFAIYEFIYNAKYIEKNGKDKKYYADITTSSLSLNENLLVYYYYITYRKSDSKKVLIHIINEFKILERIPTFLPVMSAYLFNTPNT